MASRNSPRREYRIPAEAEVEDALSHRLDRGGVHQRRPTGRLSARKTAGSAQSAESRSGFFWNAALRPLMTALATGAPSPIAGVSARVNTARRVGDVPGHGDHDRDAARDQLGGVRQGVDWISGLAGARLRGGGLARRQHHRRRTWPAAAKRSSSCPAVSQSSSPAWMSARSWSFTQCSLGTGGGAR